MEDDQLQELHQSQQELKLYSEMAIWGFSVFVTPIVGGILMAMNIPAWKGKFQAIVFSIIYTLAATYLAFIILRIPILAIALNGVGAWLITYLFWDKYIGRDTRFQPRPIWGPLIIVLLVFVIPWLLLRMLL